MKQKFKSIQSFVKGQFIVAVTIAFNLMLMLSFILIIVSAVQHFQ